MQELSWIRPPRQGRSRATLERLLRAGEALVEERPFDEVTVDEIVQRAGSSKGAFYTRFRDKESLLATMARNYYAQAHYTADAVLSPERWRGAAPQEIVRSLVTFLISHHRLHTGLFRTFVQRSVSSSKFRRLEEESNRFVADSVTRLLHGAFPGRDPGELRSSVETGVAVVFGALLKRVLHPGAFTRDDAALADELTRSFLAVVNPAGLAAVARAASVRACDAENGRSGQ